MSSGMGDAAAGALIQGLFGMGQDISNRVYERKANKQQRDHEVFMWHAQNEYNKPINQMARFKEAGLNPNLIYGQGNAGNADAPKVSQRQITPGRGLIEAGNAVSSYFQYDMMAKQKQLIDKQIQESDSRIEGREFDNALKAINAAKTKQDLQQASQLFGGTLEMQNQNIENRRLQNANLVIQNSNLDNTLKMAMSKTYQEILESRNRMSLQDVENLLKQEELKLRKTWS